MELEQIRKHMEVIGSDGGHVGRVDRLLGEDIELAQLDSAGLGMHHLIPKSWVDWVDDRVHITLTKDDAIKQWRDRP